MYYTVSQIAKKTGVTEHTIRFYTDEGILPCKRDVKNRRIFDDNSLSWLHGIQCLRSYGLSIADIKQYQKLCVQDDPRTLKERYLIIKRAAECAHEKVERVSAMAAYADAKLAHYADILNGKVDDDTRMAPDGGQQESVFAR